MLWQAASQDSDLTVVALVRLFWVPVIIEAVAAWFFAPFLLWSSLEIIIYRYQGEAPSETASRLRWPVLVQNT
jgi:hypothetical protein